MYQRISIQNVQINNKNTNNPGKKGAEFMLWQFSKEETQMAINTF